MGAEDGASGEDLGLAGPFQVHYPILQMHATRSLHPVVESGFEPRQAASWAYGPTPRPPSGPGSVGSASVVSHCSEARVPEGVTAFGHQAKGKHGC